MDWQSASRPIRRWAIKKHGIPIKCGEREFHLELNELGQLNEKEGGMGVAYRCHYIENGNEHKCWIKHTKIDETTEVEIRKRLNTANKDIIREAWIQDKIYSIGLASEVIYTGKFAVLDDDPEYEILIQREAEGKSFYDLKDDLDHSQRCDLLKVFFEALSILHKEDVYHSDLDLNHIYFDKESNKITLIDWGGATLPQDGLKEGESTTKGKPVFSPPEQKNERKYYFPQSEIFSACAVAYYFLEDKKNGFHDSPEYEDNNNYESYKLGADVQVEPSIIHTIKRATKNNPDERFASIIEMLFSWNNTSSELPSLIVKATNYSTEVNEINSTISHDDLNFHFLQDELYPSWQVDGDFEVFQTNGSMKGLWRNHKQIVIIDKPVIIKPKASERYFLLKVENRAIASVKDPEEHDSLDQSILVQEKSSNDIFELIVESKDYITLQNTLDSEELYVTRDEYESRFIEFG